jgi:hypothetical protein
MAQPSLSRLALPPSWRGATLSASRAALAFLLAVALTLPGIAGAAAAEGTKGKPAAIGEPGSAEEPASGGKSASEGKPVPAREPAVAREIEEGETAKPLVSEEGSEPDEAEAVAPYGEKRVIGATAHLREATSGLRFLARIDSGAKSCSLHAEEVRIDDPSEKMSKNIGKAVRFRVLDSKGESHWIEAEIAETVIIKTSEARDKRYKVWLTIRHGKFEKRVTVTLNDRSDMTFPLLIGRNFLRGDFVVDVERDSLD